MECYPKKKHAKFGSEHGYRITIFLISPVSVATGERSFSKLKIIKNYLRNSMGQNRLNSLAMLSIEHELAESLDYDDVTEQFAATKVRKGIFT
ncbi:hAT transposon family protein [bacterium]|nr:MAG: hAT transposon family protein [bacterium]